MKAHRQRERAKAADGEGCPGKGGIEKRPYPLPAEMPFHPPGGDEFMTQAAEEKPYRQERQYLNEIILKYDEELGYQLFQPSQHHRRVEAVAGRRNPLSSYRAIQLIIKKASVRTPAALHPPRRGK